MQLTHNSFKIEQTEDELIALNDCHKNNMNSSDGTGFKMIYLTYKKVN